MKKYIPILCLFVLSACSNGAGPLSGRGAFCGKMGAEYQSQALAFSSNEKFFNSEQELFNAYKDNYYKSVFMGAASKSDKTFVLLESDKKERLFKDWYRDNNSNLSIFSDYKAYKLDTLIQHKENAEQVFEYTTVLDTSVDNYTLRGRCSRGLTPETVIEAQEFATPIYYKTTDKDESLEVNVNVFSPEDGWNFKSYEFSFSKNNPTFSKLVSLDKANDVLAQSVGKGQSFKGFSTSLAGTPEVLYVLEPSNSSLFYVVLVYNYGQISIDVKSTFTPDTASLNALSKENKELSMNIIEFVSKNL